MILTNVLPRKLRKMEDLKYCKEPYIMLYYVINRQIEVNFNRVEAQEINSTVINKIGFERYTPDQYDIGWLTIEESNELLKTLRSYLEA